eukprot:10843907-Ditylum_brightwellii.AAC.1
MHGMHYHPPFILVPMQWDDSFFAFKVDTILDQIPALIEFNEDWLDEIKTPLPNQWQFKKALALVAPDPHTLGIKNTNSNFIPSTCL